MAFGGGVPTAEDCAFMLKHYEDDPDGVAERDPSVRYQSVIFNENRCQLQLRSDTAGLFRNGAIADAAKRIMEECGKDSEGTVDGQLLTADGDKGFVLTIQPA